jgi:hypothetical protein
MTLATAALAPAYKAGSWGTFFTMTGATGGRDVVPGREHRAESPSAGQLAAADDVR